MVNLRDLEIRSEPAEPSPGAILLLAVPPALRPALELLAVGLVTTEEQTTQNRTELLKARRDVQRFEEESERLDLKRRSIVDAYRTLRKLPDGPAGDEPIDNSMAWVLNDLREIAAVAGWVDYRASSTEGDQ